MAIENPSAVLHGIDDIKIEHRDVAPMKPRDVLLEMACVGICGSDVHYWKHGRIADFIVKEPMVLGHEASGIIKKVGSEIKHLQPGDRVAIEPGVPCFHCTFCKKGKYNLCPDMAFCATPPFHGNICKYYVHSGDMCFKLPDNVSMEAGALLEPLSVGVHACKRGGVKIGSSVLILGAGPIGLVNLITAKYMGAKKVLVTDVNPERLKVVSEFGGNPIQVTPNQSEEEFISCVVKCLGCRPDVTIDCIGFEATINQAIKTTKSGGCAVIVGLGGDPVMKVALQDALIREIDVRGVFRYCNDYADALSMVSSGKVNFDRLVTHKFTLKQTVEAFETVLCGKAIKAMIYCQK